MRAIRIVLALALLSGCAKRDAGTDLCDVARNPAEFVGRQIAISDIVIVDGHGAPVLIPDSSCKELLWFRITNGPTPDRFAELVPQLNVTTVNGHRAGLAGRYTVRVVGQPYPALVELELIDASALEIVDAQSKSEAIDKQMGVPPPDG